MLTKNNLRGNWGTLLLPVNTDESIDYNRLSGEIDYLISAGLDGIYSNGTAGEFHNQTEEEFDEIQGLLAEKCRNAGMRFQIGASHSSPIISLERIKRAVALKPDAFQVILPDWVITGEAEQVYFLQKVAETTAGIPLVLYNPPHAKTVLGPTDLCKLAKEVPQLIGIKVAGGDAQWYKDMQQCSSTLAVFVPGHFLATGFRQGASGAYSNIACLSPKGSQWWWELMQTDLDQALLLQTRILEFLDECINPYKQAGYSNPALDKFLAAVGGWSDVGTRLRWPYRWIKEDEVSAARKKALRLLPEFFKF
ncbi:MAG TPA: dihydrodipicolinate synthase family protein [Puia sp.]|nr:dihydrodipicolinate synthase family protein [Puia sp.]